MARTTADAVKKIIEVDETISDDLEPFIEIANLMVTDHCTGSSYSDAKLELIERWLTAHFYAVRDQRVQSEGVSGISQTFQTQVGMYFDLTIYGQQAMLIDSAGNLAALNAGVKKGKTRNAAIQYLGESRYWTSSEG